MCGPKISEIESELTNYFNSKGLSSDLVSNYSPRLLICRVTCGEAFWARVVGQEVRRIVYKQKYLAVRDVGYNANTKTVHFKITNREP